MTQLTRLNMGTLLRVVVLGTYDTIYEAAESLNCGDRELRRAWTRGRNPKCMGYDKMIWLFDRMGYTVKFTVEKKDEINSTVHSSQPSSTSLNT